MLDIETLFQKDGRSHLLLNPRLVESECSLYQNFFEKSAHLKDHIWVLSSGSSRTADESAKLIGLSKKAFLASAEATNKFLEVTSKDRWAVSLPNFHVGGLSIRARCLLARATAVQQPEALKSSEFVTWLETEKITLLSLVPTQIFDLVKAELKSPSSLRAVMVGGAALEEGLYLKARKLGWPLLPSYGMTETCSNIATAPLDSLRDLIYPELCLLPHAKICTNDDGLLLVRGESLLTGFWQRKSGQDLFTDPKVDGWYQTQDQVVITLHDVKTWLTPKGRGSDYIKIKGEGIDLASLRSRFTDFLLTQQLPGNLSVDLALVDIPHERDGRELVLTYTDKICEQSLQDSVNNWNESAFPLERVLKLQRLQEIPRSELGKVLWGRLRDYLTP